MIKRNKWLAVFSSVVILLPALFDVIIWNRLPEKMASHWGGDGVADGSAPKVLMVFGMPILLLAIHWLCLVLTSLDKRYAPQNKKIERIIYWLMPAVSVLVNGIVYCTALELEWNMFALLPMFLGILFIVLGNYMPKSTRNRHMGIKLPWTIGNDENWQKTHRLGGKLQVLSGVLMLISALFPVELSIGALIVALVLSVAVPTIYSYMLYRKHKAAGIVYEPVFDKKADKAAIWITAILVPLILVGVGVLMFTGDISVTCKDTEFTINASWYDDLTVAYREVDSIEFRESYDKGTRVAGFGAARLSMGNFKSDEFGKYTLYAYTACKACVVIRSGERVLVITGENAEATRNLYETLKEKIG